MDLSEKTKNWIVVGAGLTGLACAQNIEKETNDSCLILEKSEDVGGKLKTEIFEESYLLDHGFQVLLPAYSELKTRCDLSRLDLCYFESGAIIHSPKGVTQISDPLKKPSKIFETLLSNVGTFRDKLLVMKLRASVNLRSDQSLLQSSQGTSLQFLSDYGFSQDMIQNFWQPFFSGIFLEDQLETDSSYLQFLYKMFSQSPVAVPRLGIQQVPKQIAQGLRRTEIRFGQEVTKIEPGCVHLKDGSKLTGQILDARPRFTNRWGAVTTLYFAAPVSPIQGPWLVLNSRNLNRLVNHVAVLSEVSKSYAAKGDALISVNVLKTQISGPDRDRIQRDLQQMFGPQIQSWRFLKSFEIPQALPLYFQAQSDFVTPSQQGALLRSKLLG